MFGVTFMVLAPESDLVAELTTPDQKQAVDEYLEYVKKRTERDRQMDRKGDGRLLWFVCYQSVYG